MKALTKILLPVLLLIVNTPTLVGQFQADDIQTQDGTVSIIPIRHASMAIRWKKEVIYIDPSGDIDLFKNVPKPTLILITDIHGDHLNKKTLLNLKAEEVSIVAPSAVAGNLGEDFRRLSVLNNGDKTKINQVIVEAVPMYNLPESQNSRHPKGRGNGYVLTISGKRIYISGDTEDIIEMRSLADIDIAFVCMNLPYTMGVEAAADAVLDFKPKIVYPFHYRGKDGLSDIKKFKEIVTTQNSVVEVRLRDWYGR